MPESVFIETTIPSYLVADRSRDIIQMARQELTNQWWTHHRHDYDLFSSHSGNLHSRGVHRMKPETTTGTYCDEILREVWRLKEENAAAFDFDINAIAAAARKHQGTHRDRIVSRHDDLSPREDDVERSDAARENDRED